MTLLQRLERYTQGRSTEVWIVHAIVDGELDQVMVFRGFSSSLMRPTASDPDVPVLPADAVIQSVDRAMAPFNPDAPRYLDQGLSIDHVDALLAAADG